MSEAHPDPDRDGRDRSASAIRALWILGIVAIVSSSAAMVWAEQQTSAGYTDEPPLNISIAQTIFFIGPSLLTGGIVLVGLALAVTAVAGVLRMPRADPAPADPEHPGTTPETSSPLPAPAETSSPTRLDPDVFRRPRSAQDPRA